MASYTPGRFVQRVAQWEEMEYESVPMANGYSQQSSNSSNSHSSNDTDYCSVPPYIMPSSGNYEFSSSLPYDHHQNYMSYDTTSPTNDFNFSYSQPSYQQQSYSQQPLNIGPTNLRPTPMALGWDLNPKIIESYDLEFAPKESRSREPYLVLHKELFETESTPRKVYLDGESCVLIMSLVPNNALPILTTICTYQKSPKRPPPLPIPRKIVLEKHRRATGLRPTYLRPLRRPPQALRTHTRPSD